MRRVCVSSFTTPTLAIAGLLLAVIRADGAEIQFVPQSYSESSYVIDAVGMLLGWGQNSRGEWARTIRWTR